MNVILQPGDRLFIEFAAVTGSVVVDYDERHNAAIGVRWEGPEPEGDVQSFSDPTSRNVEMYAIVARQGQ